MARTENKITRTVEVHTVNVLVADMTEKDVSKMTKTKTVTLFDPCNVEKDVKRILDPSLKFVAIIFDTVDSRLYEMSVTDFCSFATCTGTGRPTKDKQ